jgi:hypothetical protein
VTVAEDNDAIEEYRHARITCELARNFLKQHDFKKLLNAISLADSVGAMLDPTLWRDKHEAMLEDKAVFEAAQKFLDVWEKAGK